MTFTYTVAGLTSGVAATRFLHEVRLRIGDTRSNGHALEDEEIDWIFDNRTTGFAFGSLIACDMALASLHANTDEDGAGNRTTRSQRTTQLKEVRIRLERELASGALPRMTGQSRSEETTERSQTDVKQPLTQKEIHRTPGLARDSALRDDDGQ
jgi:hypothetical protein